MRSSAEAYYTKTIEDRYGLVARDLLQLAHERKIKVAIQLKNHEVLLLKNEQNIGMQASENGLANAYSGSIKLSGYVFLTSDQVNALLANGELTAGQFDYYNHDSDGVLLLSDGRPTTIDILLDHLWVTREYMGAIDPSFISPEPNGRQRGEDNEMDVTARRVYLQLREKHAKVTINLMWGRLTSEPLLAPIISVNKVKKEILWDDTSHGEQTWNRDYLANKLSIYRKAYRAKPPQNQAFRKDSSKTHH